MVPADTGSLESGGTVRCPLEGRSPGRQELPGRPAPEHVQTGRGGGGEKGVWKNKKIKKIFRNTHILLHTDTLKQHIAACISSSSSIFFF